MRHNAEMIRTFRPRLWLPILVLLASVVVSAQESSSAAETTSLDLTQPATRSPLCQTEIFVCWPVTETDRSRGERQIRSVANMARQHAHNSLKSANDRHISSRATLLSLEQPNGALHAIN